MKEQLTGYVLWYADETPDTFAWELSRSVFQGQGRATIFNQQGVQSCNLNFAMDAVPPSGWPAKLNLLRTVGTWASKWGKVVAQTSYSPSPLSVQYDKWKLVNDRPDVCSADESRTYRGLASADRYVHLRGIKKFPHLFSFVLAIETSAETASEQLAIAVAEKVMAFSADRSLQWLGVMDIAPRVLDPMAAQFLLGANEPIADRLDRFMFAPSFVTLGAADVISSYGQSLNEEHPDEKFRAVVQGRAAYLAFERVASIDSVFMAQWHARRRA